MRPEIEHGAALFWLHQRNDWCHVCGLRTEPLVDCWYPKNAEHGGKRSEYIRICEGCAERMVEVCKSIRSSGDVIRR